MSDDLQVRYPAHEKLKEFFDDLGFNEQVYNMTLGSKFTDAIKELIPEFDSLLSEIARLKEMNGKLGLCVAESRDALCAAEVYMNPTNTSGMYARKQVKEQMERCQLALSELPSPPEQSGAE